MFSVSRVSPSKQFWRPDFGQIRGIIYLAIADQIEAAIVAGIFQPGDRLPTQRTIADCLGFHLNTINAAFREAARRGLVCAKARRGTVVVSGVTRAYLSEQQ